MKQAIKDLFSSKKALVMMVALIVAIASKIGLHLDPDLVNQILALAGVYIVGQGIADHGKEAAKIDAASAANDNAPTEASKAAA